MEKKKVIVVGGGFAGLNFVRSLNTRFYEVLLIDKHNHHQFQPLFYQVATSQIEPSSISFPFRYIFRSRKEIRIRLAKVLNVDRQAKKIHTTIGDFDYDLLVLAMGCKTNFFGNKELEKSTLTLKSTYDAISIRNHMLQTFEDVLTANETEKEMLLNMVVVGAGPTGVELAGAMAEIKQNILPRDFHRIDFSRLRIILIDGSPHTLNAMSPNSREKSASYLQKLGVEIITESTVESYDGANLLTSSGLRIPTRTVIWAAGVTANTLDGLPEAARAKGNRLKVDRINKLDGTDDIFVLGDMAYMETPLYPKGHPQLANVAIHQAKNLAVNLNALVKGKSMHEYEYLDLGSMATIGKNKAVVDLPRLRFSGFFAWFIWMSLHLMLILSVKNKLIIFINWVWSYISRNSALRIILKDSEP